MAEGDITSREKKAVADSKACAPKLSAYLDAEQVRKFMASDSIGLTALGVDLAFTPEEISDAMVGCARRFNGIPPYIMEVEPDQLPGRTSIFMDGIAAELYALEYRKLSNQDIDYTGGSVNTNLVSARLKHVEKLRKEHLEAFTIAARDMKRHKNVMSFMRHY